MVYPPIDTRQSAIQVLTRPGAEQLYMQGSICQGYNTVLEMADPCCKNSWQKSLIY